MPKVPLDIISGEYQIDGAANNVALNMVPIPIESAGVSKIISEQPSSIIGYYDRVLGTASNPSGPLNGWLQVYTSNTFGVIMIIGGYFWEFQTLQLTLRPIYQTGTTTQLQSFNGSIETYRMAYNGEVIAIVRTDGSDNTDFYLTLTGRPAANGGFLEGTLDRIRVIEPNYRTLTNSQGAIDVTYLDGYLVYLTAGEFGESPRVFHSTLKTVNQGKDIRLEDFQDIDENAIGTSLFSYRGQLVAATNKSTYFYQNVGNVNFAFQRLKGQELDYGIRQAFSYSGYRLLSDDVGIIASSKTGATSINTLKTGKISDNFIDRRLAEIPINGNVYLSQYIDRNKQYLAVNFPSDDSPALDNNGETYAYDFTTGLWHQRSSKSANENEGSKMYWPIDGVTAKLFGVADGYFLIGPEAEITIKNGERTYVGRAEGFKGDFEDVSDQGDFNEYEITTAPISNTNSTVSINSVGISAFQLDGTVELSQTDDLSNYVSQGAIEISQLQGEPEYLEWRRLGYSRNTKQFKFTYSGSDGSTPYTLVAPYAFGEVTND